MQQSSFTPAEPERRPSDLQGTADPLLSAVEQMRDAVTLSAALQLPPLRTLAARTIEVAIVGGTVAGLATASTVAESGMRVLVLEAAPALGRGLDDIRLLVMLGQLADLARSAGVVLAGEARVISCMEERGCAGSAHWRLKTQDGVSIPARGFIVACAVASLAAPPDAAAPARAGQRLGEVAPGVFALDAAMVTGCPPDLDAAYRNGRATALDMVLVRRLRPNTMSVASDGFQ